MLRSLVGSEMCIRDRYNVASTYGFARYGRSQYQGGETVFVLIPSEYGTGKYGTAQYQGGETRFLSQVGKYGTAKYGTAKYGG